MLGGWYLLLVLLAALAAMSAGLRTWSGLLAFAAAAAAGLLLVTTLFGVPGAAALANNWTAVSTALVGLCLGTGVVLMVAARRQDTKLIALLLAGASLLPLAAFYWRPGQ